MSETATTKERVMSHIKGIREAVHSPLFETRDVVEEVKHARRLAKIADFGQYFTDMTHAEMKDKFKALMDAVDNTKIPAHGWRAPPAVPTHVHAHTTETAMTSTTTYNGVSEEMHNHLVRCFKALGSACKVDLGNGPIVRGTTQIQCVGVFFGEGISFTIEGEGVVIRFGSNPKFAYFLPLRGSRFPTSAWFQATWKSAEDDRAEVRAEFNGVSTELHAHFLRCLRAVEHAINMRFGLSIRRGTTMVSCNNALRSGGVCFVVDVENDTIRIKFEAAPNYSYAIALGEPFPTYDELKNVWASAFEEAERFANERAPSTYSTDLAGLVERFKAIRAPNSGVVSVYTRSKGRRFVCGANHVRDAAEIVANARVYGPGRYSIELEELVPVGGDEVVRHVRDVVKVMIPEEPVPKRTFSKVTELKIKHEDRDEEDEREQERERKADIAFSEYEKRKDALKLPLSIEYVQIILDGMLEERGFARGRLVVADVANDFCLYDYNAYSLGRFTRIGLDYLKLTETVNAWCVHKEKQRRDAFRHALDFFGGMHPDEQFVSMPHATPTLRDGLTPVVVIDLFNEAEDAYERHRTDPMHSGDRREHYHEWGMRKAAEIKERLTVDARNTLREWPTCEGVPMKIEVTEPTGKGIFIARWVKG